MSPERELSADVAGRASALFSEMRAGIFRARQIICRPVRVSVARESSPRCSSRQPPGRVNKAKHTSTMGRNISRWCDCDSAACNGAGDAGPHVTRHVIASRRCSRRPADTSERGRIETHFHYFGSLAFLAFYRGLACADNRLDCRSRNHVVRGSYFPLSMYG